MDQSMDSDNSQLPSPEVKRPPRHPTKQQKKRLLQMIAEQPLLISCKFTPEFSVTDARVLWQKITQELNGYPDGTRRTWKQWRKTWQDMSAKFKISSRTGIIPKTIAMLTPAEQEMFGFKNVRSTNHSNSIQVRVKKEITNSLTGPEYPSENKIFATSYTGQNLSSFSRQDTNDILAEHEQKKLELKEEFINYKKDYLRKKLKLMQEQTEALKAIARELSDM